MHYRVPKITVNQLQGHMFRPREHSAIATLRDLAIYTSSYSIL